MLYGRLYRRRCGLRGSRAELFMGKGQSRNTSGVSLPSLAFGLDPYKADNHVKLATCQNEVRAVVGEGAELW